jgi:hypothetical protein
MTNASVASSNPATKPPEKRKSTEASTALTPVMFTAKGAIFMAPTCNQNISIRLVEIPDSQLTK